MTRFLEKVEIFNAEVGLKLNRAKCSIMKIDGEEILSVLFDSIPDMKRKGNIIYLEVRI